MKKAGTVHFLSALSISVIAFLLCALQSYASMYSIVGNHLSASSLEASLLGDIFFLSFITVLTYSLPNVYFSFPVLKPTQRITKIILGFFFTTLLYVGFFSIFMVAGRLSGRWTIYIDGYNNVELNALASAAFAYFLLPVIYSLLPTSKMKNLFSSIFLALFLMVVLTIGFMGINFWLQSLHDISALGLLRILIFVISILLIIPKLTRKNPSFPSAPYAAFFLTIGYAILCFLINFNIFNDRIASWSAYITYQKIGELCSNTPTLWVILLSSIIFFFAFRIIHAHALASINAINRS